MPQARTLATRRNDDSINHTRSRNNHGAAAPSLPAPPGYEPTSNVWGRVATMKPAKGRTFVAALLHGVASLA